MICSFRNSVSLHGHSKDVLISALQKYIRRGDLDKSIYVANEIMMFSQFYGTDQDKTAKSIITNFGNRLRVILVEDIGIANPALPILFDELYDKFERNKGDMYEFGKYIYGMIKLLVESPKVRLASDIKAVFFKSNKKTNLTIEEGIKYAIKNKSDVGFYYLRDIVNQTLNGDNKAVDKIFEYIKKFNVVDIRIYDIIKKYNKHFGPKPNNSHRDHLIFVIWMGLYAFRNIPQISTNLKSGLELNSPDIPTDTEFRTMIENHKKSESLIFEDFIYDVHTSKGRNLQRNAKDFVQSGAIVFKEVNELVNPIYREIYIKSKDNINVDDLLKMEDIQEDTKPKNKITAYLVQDINFKELVHPVIEKLPEYLINEMKKAPIGQKPTAAYKAIVYIIKNPEPIVLKGPFKDLHVLTMQNFRYYALQIMGDNVSGPFKIYTYNNEYYISIPMIYTKPVEEWISNDNIIDKKSMGIIEFSKYVKFEPNKNDDIVYRGLVHFIHRFIIDPIIGDASLRNVLVVNDDIIGIDFLENRGNQEYEGDDIIGIISGDKRWAKAERDYFNELINKKKNILIEHLESIDFEKIKKYIVNIDVNINNMIKKNNYLIKLLKNEKITILNGDEKIQTIICENTPASSGEKIPILNGGEKIQTIICENTPINKKSPKTNIQIKDDGIHCMGITKQNIQCKNKTYPYCRHHC